MQHKTTAIDASAPISPAKREILDLSIRHVIPGRVRTFEGMGIPLVIGRREGYRIWDHDGHELMDFHLNGGTYNLGHRNPEILEALQGALQHLDVGNHHFASEWRAKLAEKLSASTQGRLQYTVFASGGSEANDIAIKSARQFTGRRKIVALTQGYHGRTGLSGAAGDDETARYFLSDYPQEFIKVPFNDLQAMEAALRDESVAAVLMETIPATYGFPVPADGYLAGVAALCRRYGTLYVADEVQTGLGRTGHLWATDGWGVEPDIMVVGKGLSGGIYPIAAAVMREEVGRWLLENAWGHVSTFGGAEPGCVVGLKVLERCSDAQVLQGARRTSERLVQGLQRIQAQHGFLTEIRHSGLVMGLKFDSPTGGVDMMGALYRCGIWAIFAGFDHSVLQFKPGLLVDDAYCDEALERFESAIRIVKRK